MRIHDENSLSINGKDYWSVRQFAKLTGREDASVRYLITHGNNLRNLKADHFEGRPFIRAEELFEFPFASPGKPSPIGQIVEKFVLQGESLVTKKFIIQGEEISPLEEKIEQVV